MGDRSRYGGSAPGWYRDPDDPTRFRHWTGRTWSNHVRGWPAWDLASADVVADPALPGGPASAPEAGPVQEGPVSPVPMPAAVRSRLGADGSVSWLRGYETGARTQRRLPRSSGGVPPRHHRAASPGWASSRRPLAAFAALVGVAILVMAVSVGLSQPATGTVSAVDADPAFVTRAAAVCRSGLEPLRQSAAATMSAAPSDPTQLAAAADRNATSARSVELRLRNISPSASAQASVSAWLAGWDGYVAAERQLAAALRTPALTSPGATGGPDSVELAQRVEADEVRADGFAESNDLADCRLGATPTAAGPVVAIP